MIQFARDLLKKYGFKNHVIAIGDKERQRPVFYNPKSTFIEVKFKKLEYAANNFGINVEEYLTILVAREMGIIIDEGTNNRYLQKERIIELVTKGKGSPELIENLKEMTLYEQRKGNENGLVFVPMNLHEKYKEIVEKYLFLEVSRIEGTARSIKINLDIELLKERVR